MWTNEKCNLLFFSKLHFYQETPNVDVCIEVYVKLVLCQTTGLGQ